jgi:hypothetical protein
MVSRTAGVWLVVVGLVVACVAHAQVVAQRPTARSAWTLARTADGQPDLEGVWANNNMTPLERPAQFKGRAMMTDQELSDLKAKVTVLLDGGDAFFFDELVLAALEGKAKFTSADTQTGNYDQSWLSERIFDNRTSLVIDPPDGRIPPLTAAAVQRARDRAAARQGLGPADRVQDMSLSTRCIHFGTPNIMAGYQSYFAVSQAPGYVVLRTEMGHDARVIPLDGRPHASRAITQYHGDSTGRWEGDTLVVDTVNFSSKTNFRGASETLHLVEKFRRVAEDTIEYSITVDDATTWTKPWTLMIPLKRTGEGMFEYACHEGNYGLPAILRGARAQERQAARGQ